MLLASGTRLNGRLTVAAARMVAATAPAALRWPLRDDPDESVGRSANGSLLAAGSARH